MLFLVSTQQTQGKRKNDFCFVPEGEPVHYGVECFGEKVDGHCGCKRSLVGIDCAKATTTMKVVELPDEERANIINRLSQHYQRAWSVPQEKSVSLATKEVSEIEAMLKPSWVGMVFERRGKSLQSRTTIQ